jgi:uncharacterized protein YceK
MLKTIGVLVLVSALDGCGAAVSSNSTPSAGAGASASVPSAKTTSKAKTYGTGTYEVGVDMPAGKYKTAGPDENDVFKNCYWARKKNDSGEFDSIISNDNLGGPGVVTIKKGEIFETNGCQVWVLSK